VIVELKREKTPREIRAQVMDYGFWVKDFSNEEITKITETYLCILAHPPKKCIFHG
jgi:hypothetical protein